MKSRKTYLFLLIFVLLLAGCSYRKGSAYTWSGTADTIKYVIVTSGTGNRILRKAAHQVRIHRLRADDCHVIYVSDSASLHHNRSILLFNSVLPDIKADMLSKGFIGTFGSRQVITYLVVDRGDFAKQFTPTD